MNKIDMKLLSELKQTQGFSERFVESLQDGFLIINLKGKIILANTAISQITGFNKEELLNAGLPFPFWPPESHKDFKNRFANISKDKLNREFEVDYIHKSGARFPVVVLITGIKNNKNKTIAYLAVIQDGLISNKNAIDEDSQNSEIFSFLNYRKKYLDLIIDKKIASQLDDTLNNISDGFVSLDNNMCYTYVNNKAGEFFGRKPSSLIGKHIWTEFPNAVGLPFYDTYLKAIETQQTQHLEEFYESFDKWFENRIYPTPEGLSIYFTDITERIKNEERLFESERKLDNIINNIGDPLFVKNEDSQILLVNEAFCKMHGLSRDSIIGKTLAEHINPKEMEGFLKIDKLVLSTGIENLSEEILTVTDNQKRIISTKKTRFIDESGAKFLIGVLRDITDKKKTEKNNNMLRSLTETSDNFVGLASLNGIPFYLNENGKDMAGLDPEEELPTNIIDFFPQHYHDTILNEHLPTIQHKKKWTGEAHFQNFKTGDLIPIEMSGFLIEDTITNKPIALGIVARNITNRKKTEITLKENEQSLVVAQRIAKTGSFKLDLKTRKIDGSPTFMEIMGVDLNSEFTADDWKSLIHTEDVSENLKLFQECVESRGLFDMEFRILTNDYKILKWIHGLGEITFVDGKAVNFFGTAQDITERKEAEIRLVESEANLKTSQSVASIGSFSFDIDQTTWKSSAIMDKIFGIDKSFDKTFESWTQLVHPEDREGLINYYENNIIKNHEKFDKEYRIIKEDNKQISWVHGLGELTFNNDGDLIKIIGTTQDITERKQSEIELKQAKEFSENVISSLQEGLLTISIDSEILNVNPSFCKMTGFTKEELIGSKPPYPYWPPEEVPRIIRNFKKSIKGEQSKFEDTLMRKNGERFPASIQSSLFLNEEGINNGFVATIDDVSNYVNTLAELEQAKEFSENLILNLNDGLSVVNFDGIQIDANPALCKMMGFKREELIGQKAPFNYWPPEEYDKIKEAFSKTIKGEYLQFNLILMRKNGERFPVVLTTSSIKNNKGENIANFATIQDVSERVKAQKLLESKAEKSVEKKDVILKLSGLAGNDLIESFRSITKEAALLLNIERVSIWSFNQDKTEVFCEELYLSKSNLYSKGHKISKEDNPNYFEALYKNQTILVTDVLNDSITKKFAKDYLIPNKIASLMDVFINSANGYYGVICFEHVGEPRIWTSEEQEFAISIASIVSIMVESNERKLAENKISLTNELLTQANKELNVLRNELEQENVYLRNELDLVFNYEEMIYGSTVFSNVLTEVEKVAPTNATVLLLGESGTGKELLARALHTTSLRNKKPLIKVNCSAIPRELIESELFGHKKGSFTGAFSDKIGKFEMADGGTLFLDEIGELPLDMQPKILRFRGQYLNAYLSC